ncbi:MAG: helix-turn-helix domain-containing protein [Parcubacteria group bacterium]|jgi:sugar-specific transcriptional regulator TrmB
MEQDELKKSLYKGLKELGLSEAEINLYVISLKLGQTSIVNVARHMGISRPNVYKVIFSLEKHGLAKFSEKGKYARAFMVESPTFVLEMIRKKREDMSEIDHNLVSSLPDLLTKYHQGQAPTKVRVLQGKEHFLKIFNQSLEEENKEVLFFGATEDFIGFISWTEERKWITKRVKRNIFVKVLTLPGKEGAEILRPQDQAELRETRILKGTWPFMTSFQLFANKVVIWQPKAPLALLIEDQYIVEMLKSMFDFMWEKSVEK